MKLKVIVSALAAVVVVSAATMAINWNFDLQDTGFRSVDHTEKVRRVSRAAEQGDTRAQIFLGYMYQNGRGVP